MELILDINVKITGSTEIKGSLSSAAVIFFTGTAEGKYFSGSIKGTGTDCQLTGKDGICRLSARYVLEGTDCAGSPCRIFIENNGSFESGFSPRIVTESKALSDWEGAKLSAEVSPRGDEVSVKIYRE